MVLTQSPFPWGEGGHSPEMLFHQLLDSLNSSSFVIVMQRQHLAFPSWSAEKFSSSLLPWAPSPVPD